MGNDKTCNQTIFCAENEMVRREPTTAAEASAKLMCYCNPIVQNLFIYWMLSQT